MSLFQPTFVIPSTRTEGTVDVSDNMEVKWQVNGQSAMIAFKIDFFRNDWSSTFVNTTGRQPVANGGFRGIDRFGRIEFYTYAPPNFVWRQLGLINGMQYKIQITQYYIDNPYEYYVRTTAVIDTETACYFAVPNKNDSTQIDYYLFFTLPEGKYPMNTKIAYNIANGDGYVILNNTKEFLTMTKLTTKPITGNDLGISTNEESVVQRSMDVFRTYTKPTMALYKTPNEDFIWQDGVGEELLNPRNLSITTSIDLGAGSNNYFSFIQNGTQTKYASFTTDRLLSANTIIFYNTQTKQCYYELNGEQISLIITESTTQPTDATNIGKAYIDLATSIGYFHTNYMQEEGKPIRWVEWQVATANDGVVGDIIADTGKINTQTLDYSYNGFFNGQQYAIRCHGYSESEQYCDTGWIIFNVNIKAQGEYTGNFSVQCLPKENATLLQWEGVEVIPPRVSPDGYKPLISNGSVTLAPKNQETGEEYSVTWNKQIINDNRESKTIPMNFEEPWTAVCKENARFNSNFLNKIMIEEEIMAMSYNSKGDYLIIGTRGNIGSKISLYHILNNELIFMNAIYATSQISRITFSPIKDMFVINSGTNNKLEIFVIANSRIEKVKSLNIQLAYNYYSGDFKFSNNGKFFVVTASIANAKRGDGISLYSVENTDFIFIKDLIEYDDTIKQASSITFSANDTMLVVSGYSDGKNYLNEILIKYILVENNYEYDGKIIQGKNDSIMRLPVAFSSDNILAAGSFDYTTRISKIIFYIIENNILTYAYEKSFDNPSHLEVFDLKFSVEGNTLICTRFASIKVYDITMFIVNINQCIFFKLLKEMLGSKNINYPKVQFDPKNSGYIIGSSYRQENNQPISELSNYNYNTSNGILNEIELNALNKLQIIKQGIPLYLSYNNNIITPPLYVDSFDNVTAIIQNNKAIFNFYNNNQLVEKKVVEINLPQEPITSISINGGDNGIKVDSVSVFKGDGDDIIQLYDDNPNFEPVWNSEDYQLYMTANFNGNLEGGTGTSTGSGFRVYRREYNSNVLFPIATVPSTTLQAKDFGLRSGKAYEYYLYVYDSNGSFMTNVEGNQRVAAKYNSYSLMVCDYDSDRDEYHVRKQYLFALNASEGAMSNNNTPTINKNFTSYPTIMNSTSNYVSGNLSSLIGVIYTVPALIEQIGTYKFVKKPSTLDYFDNVDLQKELFQLSTLPYQLFLRDMKGNMRMVKITAPISMTVNTKQTQLSTMISIQWTEIDNADDVTVIQTPDDYGWNNDNQLLDVKLDVDTSTGELYAQYPRQYRGTKFTLVGANKEILQANTPIGITPADITLSNVANKTTDGELNATIKINKE